MNRNYRRQRTLSIVTIVGLLCLFGGIALDLLYERRRLAAILAGAGVIVMLVARRFGTRSLGRQGTGRRLIEE